MTDEDLRTGEKRRSQGCLYWAVGGITGFLMFFAYASSQLDLFTGERAERPGSHSRYIAKLTLERLIKECAVKDAELGLAHPAMPLHMMI